MLKYYVIALALMATATAASDTNKQIKQSPDPFTLMDSIFRNLFPPRVKVWPWYDIFEDANPLEDPKLVSTKNKCEIDLFVRRFRPEELRVRVKNRYVIIEGKRQGSKEDSHFSVNRFVQNFALPPGCKEDEVVAVFEKGVLSISAPKHPLPPPPPEREVPIEVKNPIEEPTSTQKQELESSTEKQVSQSPVAEKEEVELKPVTHDVLPLQTSSATPLDQLDLVEATTHVGKIRKKDLKIVPKKPKDNEVVKGSGNGLDYSILDSENE